jgi:hypothetical protein
MTRPDIGSILSDGTKDTKYIIIHRAYNSVNGIDLFPVIAKRKEINIGYYLQQITLSNRKTLVTIHFNRIENIVKYDDCIFGRI